MTGILKIPDSAKEAYNLPTNEISGKYIKDLWDLEIKNNKELRLLHHPNAEDFDPDHRLKMNVGSATRYFSLQTAVALESGIERGQLPEEAKTTAWFVSKVYDWFHLTSSRICKTSITRRNKAAKLYLLEEWINLFEEMQIKGTQWKPLNRGMILSSLSLIDCINFLFDRGFQFVLLSRFSQDALENVFSQVRRRFGNAPTVLDSLRAFKLITLSQFMTEIKRTSYVAEPDVFLVEFLSNKSNTKNVETDSLNNNIVPLVANRTDIDANFDEPFPTSDVSADTLDVDVHILCNLAGSTTNALLKKKICDSCINFLKDNAVVDPSFDRLITLLNKGGLKYPNVFLFQLIYNTEILYLKYKNYIIHNCSSSLIEKIVHDINVPLPLCCNLKKLAVQHFFTVRGFIVANFSVGTKRKKKMYGTSTIKKAKAYSKS